DSTQDDGWEVISKKNKNKPTNTASSKLYASQTPKQNARDQRANTSIPQDFPVDEDVEDDNETESEDEILSDEYDSDEGSKSHEERKKNRWHSDFFGTLDRLTLEQINEGLDLGLETNYWEL
nr:protein suppressor of gene silencing 3 [Tanacetum cinerariifolium]